MKLVLSSSPHLRTPESTRKVMYWTLASLVPPAAGAVWFFGPYALALILVSAAAAALTEYLFLLGRKQDPKAALDGSAFITGVLLALTLPPQFPLWAAALGSAFAIAFGKQVFGGLGYNIFNPALLGRAFLMAAFPVQSTTWTKPLTLQPDAWTGATPLASAKFSKVLAPYMSMFWGNTGGSLGETSVALILIGGIFLVLKGYIDWALPLSYIATVGILGQLFHLINPAAFPQDGLYHILAGGLMLGAVYMITDMVTSPMTRAGRVVYGVLAGILVIVIRLFGGLPEGVMYSILLVNGLRPWIDRAFVPKIYGEVAK